ncbi:cupin domain-containing protein [Wenxinia marina]|nr:cupin domain-containing protein [Wenxinia marina]
MKLSRADWLRGPDRWRGHVDGARFGAGVTVLFYATETVGEGPKLHVHTYDEIFVIRQGRARFTIGDETIDAEEGDVLFGPANVPHKFVNLGPGRLDTVDIHHSPEWVQTNLE